MRLKNILLIFLLGVLCNLNAQNNSESILQDLSPPTPNSFQLGRYGNIPINYSTGAFNYSVPLWEIKEGNISVPINLSYSTNGVKVDQIASNVGLNWVLNTGGIISRVVKDTPDENARYRYYHNLNDREHTTYIRQISSCKYLKLYDTQQDWFSFNFAGLSGSFYFDEDLNIHISSRNTISINFNQSNNEFTVVNEYGTKYTFGGIGAIEQTSTYTYGHINPCETEPITTAWYLKKVTDSADKSEINFEYDVMGRQTNLLGYSFTRKKILDNNCPGFYQGQISEGNYPSILTQFSYDLKLSNIKFNNGKITFINSAEGNREDTNSYRVDGIQVFAKNNNQYKKIKEYEFKYDYAVSTVFETNVHNNYVKSKLFSFEYEKLKKRLFLTEVIEKGNGTNDNVSHRFVYKSKDQLPPRLSSHNDYWGFSQRYTSKKEEPSDWLYRGVMDSIIYPTKGHTKIEYEPNEKVFLQNTKKYESVEIHSDNNCIIGKRTNPESMSFTAMDSKMVVSANLNACGAIEYSGEIFIEVKNLTNNSSSIISNVNGEHIIREQDVFIEQGHDYQIKISTQYNSNDFFVNANIKYFDGEYIEEEVNEYYGGIRVKKLINSPDGQKKEVKKMYYQNMENAFNNIPYTSTLTYGHRTFVPELRVAYLEKADDAGCGEPFENTTVSVIVQETTASTFTNLYANRESQVYYDTVTIGNGEHFENGGEEKTFFVNSYIPSSILSDVFSSVVDCDFFTPRTPLSSGFNGMEEGVKLFKKNQGNIQPVKEIKYDYKYFNEREFINSNIINRLISGYSATVEILPWTDLKFASKCVFKNKTFQVRLKKQTEILYIDGLPTVSNETEYFYDNSNHLQVTRTERILGDNKKYSTKIYYPHDKDQLIDITTVSSLALDQLITQHRIATPIQVESIVRKTNGTLLSRTTQRTNFLDWGNGLYLPQFRLNLKGDYDNRTNRFDPQVQYHNYSNKGNVEEISRTDGIHIVYIWGYNDEYPIAKIENTTYTDVSAYVANLKTKSNLDNDRTQGYTGNEGALRQDLDALRNVLPNAMVSTYTYDPLIGVTSMTDPRGYTMYYHYDDFNRLKFVKDAAGNLVSENKYNYKN